MNSESFSDFSSEPMTQTIATSVASVGFASVVRSSVEAGKRIGQYELIRELGRGGMGQVFLARDIRLGRRVALKLLAKRSDRLIQRFLTEAQATARCRHENIVVIHDVGEFDGQPYMVLEYIKGPTLREWLREKRQQQDVLTLNMAEREHGVAVAVAVDMMIHVVRALENAHAHGIVHRDLKPANIILADSGTVKVFDFGVAKLLDTTSAVEAGTEEIEGVSDPESTPDDESDSDHKTRAGSFMGTLPYMSPEQWNSEEIDPRTDIWAVGIILHELVTGRHPLDPLSKKRLEPVANLDIPIPQARDNYPQLGQLGAIIDRCLAKRKHERFNSATALLEQLELLLGDRDAIESDEEQNPFAGLAPFQEVDAARFFGRAHEVARLISHLHQHQFVTITGTSGVGKSSFIRAGVIPTLKRLGEGWEVCIVRPGRHPLETLAAATVTSTGMSALTRTKQLVDTWRDQPGHLGALLRERCRQRAGRMLLFVDQFDELYHADIKDDERDTFIACLKGVADDLSSPLRVVLALRSDRLERIADDPEFMAQVTRGMMFLSPMTRDNVRDALTRPLERVDYRFESVELVENMLDSLQSMANPLPLLQFTAHKLWEMRAEQDRLLTMDSYASIGGMAGALAVHADSVVVRLSAAERRLARTVFLRLVTQERTRASVRMVDIRRLADEPDEIERMVEHLADVHLVLLERDAEVEDATVTLVHESLIDEWSKLVQWLDESEQDEQFLSSLHSAAAQWESQGEFEGMLWRGRAALSAEAWMERRYEGNLLAGLASSRGESGGSRTPMEPRDERYLRAVVEQSRRLRRKARRGVVGAFVFLGTIALVVSYMGVRADREARRAQSQAERADREVATRLEQKKQLEMSAVRARNGARMAAARGHLGDPTTVIALLRELEPQQTPRGWRELAQWALQRDIAHVVITLPSVVRWASFSPDGTRIVTASWDQNARVWNADGSGNPVILHGHKDRLVSAMFSPDGQRIITSSADKTARVWNADGSGEAIVLRGHDREIWSAAFSPTGDRVATSSTDATVRVWNADGSGAPIILRGHEQSVSSCSFDRSGHRIVSSSLDDTVRVWNADGSGEPMILRGHDKRVYWATFDPDGSRVVTASADKTARVYRLDQSAPPIVLRGHDDRVYSAEFSPDGAHIVTASSDSTVRVWNSDGSGEPRVLRAHADRVYRAEFSSDGNRLVTASKDRTVRVWNTDDLSNKRSVNMTAYPAGDVGSLERTEPVQVFTEEEQLRELDDPRLWTTTSYCMSVERRQRLLDVTEYMASLNQQSCIAHVQRAHQGHRPLSK